MLFLQVISEDRDSVIWICCDPIFKVAPGFALIRLFLWFSIFHLPPALGHFINGVNQNEKGWVHSFTLQNFNCLGPAVIAWAGRIGAGRGNHQQNGLLPGAHARVETIIGVVRGMLVVFVHNPTVDTRTIPRLAHNHLKF